MQREAAAPFWHRRRHCAASTCLTAAALLGFSLSNRLGWLCLFAIPLGLGAGAVDTALNHYVSLHYKALHMNFLHCAYGVGVSLSPYLMSFFIRAEGGWRAGYRSAFWIQAAIAMVTVLSLPLWKRAHRDDESHVGEEKSKTLGFRALLRLPGVRYAWLMFTGSCAIEYTCGVWGSTFLVSSKGLAVERAAWIVVFYYVGMTLGRFLSGILSVRLSGWRLIFLGQGAILTAIIMLLLPLPPAVAGTGLFFAGLGVGPLFPNLIHLTPANFGREASQSVMGSQMAAAYLGIMLVPPVFGFLAQKIGTWIFPGFFAFAVCYSDNIYPFTGAGTKKGRALCRIAAGNRHKQRREGGSSRRPFSFGVFGERGMRPARIHPFD